jgi:hypothetical protein
MKGKLVSSTIMSWTGEELASNSIVMSCAQIVENVGKK